MGPNCTPTGGSDSQIVVPADGGNLTDGMSPAWFFLYLQSTPLAMFFVGAINGTSVYFGEIQQSVEPGEWGRCVAAPGYSADTPITTGILDSTQAAADAGSPAWSFATSHPVDISGLTVLGNKTWSGGGAPYTGPTWTLNEWSCESGWNSLGYYFAETLSASSGSPLAGCVFRVFPKPQGCPGLSPFFPNLGAGYP